MIRTGLNTKSALTVQRINIAQGSKRAYLLSRLVLYVAGLTLLVFSLRVLCHTFLSFGVNAVMLRVSAMPILVLFFAATCSELNNIATSAYYIEDGVLLGRKVRVDLWNLEEVGYGSHRVYLNNEVLPYVANPKVFLESLELEYFNLTGENLP